MRHGHLCRRFSTRRSPAVRATVAAAPSLREFLAPTTDGATTSTTTLDDASPYVDASLLRGDGRTVHVETYGCQMNVSDSEVVAAVLRDAGYGRSASAADADVVLLNTCAIREGAESKIWQRLRELRARGRERRAARSGRPPLVGVLGCMGERLKGKLLESPTAHDRLADLVCGPDAYRSLPRLLAEAGSGQPALDVALSLEETYAEIAPVREGSDGVSAFVSIMRGCNNMCSYCIVPHTRGRERSRDATSIAAEVAALADAGYREVTLLGQNVNSYADSTSGTDGAADSAAYAEAQRAAGFNPMVPPPTASLRFGGLLEMLADAHPEVRFRFTSPHPKDFPDEVLDAIATRPNLCESLHIPAQSGSTSVLQSMRRGYSREAYLDLAARVRERLPSVAISSDFISGFCGESEEDHLETLSLMEEVRYEKAFMFAYSLREKTHAHRKLSDDVPEAVKKRRLREVIEVFNAGAREANDEEVGRHHLLLVERVSKKSEGEWVGRTDTNKTVVFARRPTAASHHEASEVELQPGDYVAARVTAALSHNTLRAVPLARSSIEQFDASRRDGHARLVSIGG